MRFLLLTFLSVLVVSCGQSGSSSSSKKSDNRQNEEYTSDVRGVDLLDVAVDVPVDTSGNKIVFKQAVTDSANGVHSACSVGVAAGEAYDYRVDGSALSITTSAGQRLTFSRVSGEGNSIVGSWFSKTPGDQLILRRFTFVSENQVIMRTHCEG